MNIAQERSIPLLSRCSMSGEKDPFTEGWTGKAPRAMDPSLPSCRKVLDRHTRFGRKVL